MRLLILLESGGVVERSRKGLPRRVLTQLDEAAIEQAPAPCVVCSARRDFQRKAGVVKRSSTGSKRGGGVAANGLRTASGNGPEGSPGSVPASGLDRAKRTGNGSASVTRWQRKVPPRVAKRFATEAAANHPESGWILLMHGVRWLSCPIALVVVLGNIDPTWGSLTWLYVVGYGLVLPGVLVALSVVVDAPGRRRRRAIDTHVAALVLERHRRLRARADRFYTSWEWRNLRLAVLSEEPPVCNACGVGIADPRDLIVDHVQPRSRFPELALDRANLQILCRSCNSAKGAN